MIPNSRGFVIAEDGTVDIWSPAHPAAFHKARKHSHQRLKRHSRQSKMLARRSAYRSTTLILVFSASRDEHTKYCLKVLQMLEDRSMPANVNDCVFYSKTSIDAGIQLEQVGHKKVYLVINKGVPGLS
ncbi:hypothetical protein V8C42DRAFT_363226 [Trichoderma barbatum]